MRVLLLQAKTSDEFGSDFVGQKINESALITYIITTPCEAIRKTKKEKTNKGIVHIASQASALRDL